MEPEAISISQINLYLTCSLKYRFQYIDRLPRLVQSAGLVFGSAMHKALEWLHKERRNGRNPHIVLMRLRQLLRMAHQRGYLAEDRSSWVVKVRDSRPEIFPLSFEEKDRFINALPRRWQPYFIVAFGTGLRPSEQIALKKEAIDWERGKILVREGWRQGQVTRLKAQGSAREIDILPAVRKALEAQRLVSAGSDLVFPNISGKHINIANLRRRVWYATLAKAKLRPRDLYNTRHTFATHALAAGEDPGWVAKMLGHTTLHMLVTRYYQYVPNLTRKDGTLLAKWLERGGPTRRGA
jgi:integrase